MSRSLLRIPSALFALLFLFGAAVQWNDPDPLRWMLAYGAVAALSAGAAAGRLAVAPTAVVLAALLVWLALWSPAFADASPGAARSFGMSGDVREEEVREAFGLALLAAWTTVLLVAAWRAHARHGSPDDGC